jgi:chorismate mutase
MSYFPIDADKMINEEKNMQKMTHEKPIKKAPHSVPHTPEARKKIADTQRERYRMIEALIKKAKQKPLSEERVREICANIIDDYCKRNAFIVKPNNNSNKKPIDINL